VRDGDLAKRIEEESERKEGRRGGGSECKSGGVGKRLKGRGGGWGVGSGRASGEGREGEGGGGWG